MAAAGNPFVASTVLGTTEDIAAKFRGGLLTVADGGISAEEWVKAYRIEEPPAAEEIAEQLLERLQNDFKGLSMVFNRAGKGSLRDGALARLLVLATKMTKADPDAFKAVYGLLGENIPSLTKIELLGIAFGLAVRFEDYLRLYPLAHADLRLKIYEESLGIAETYEEVMEVVANATDDRLIRQSRVKAFDLLKRLGPEARRDQLRLFTQSCGDEEMNRKVTSYYLELDWCKLAAAAKEYVADEVLAHPYDERRARAKTLWHDANDDFSFLFNRCSGEPDLEQRLFARVVELEGHHPGTFEPQVLAWAHTVLQDRTLLRRVAAQIWAYIESHKDSVVDDE